jgi:hypothetical protein
MPQICIEDGCCTRCNYNLPTEKTGLYCREHKNADMINVNDKKCIKERCLKIPSYNFPMKREKLYCFEHKKENMINVKDNKRKYSDI